MALLQSPTLMFKVRRCQPELVAPAIPTPHEIKLLSDIDGQEGLRFHFPFIQIYRHEPSMARKDPVEVIRRALAKTLVFYYPFAGRLREGHNRKLMVDCTGEGVLFIEADADVKLDELNGALHPPFPCFEELLYDVPGSHGITDCPILLMQVTRLKCSGFILVTRVNHTMCDGSGFKLFITTLTEMARGESQPSIPPVWQRDLLRARDPPRVTCNHREYEQVISTTEKKGSINSYEDDDDMMIQRSVFFGPTEIAILRRLVPRHLGECTRCDVITACLWYCRTKALQIEPDEEVCMMCVVNARARFNPPLPVGYYGNGIALSAAVTTAGKLCENPFWYAVELIKKAKVEAIEEYMNSVADLMVTKGRPLFTTTRSCIVSNITRFGFREVDFGWGNAVYAGIAKGGAGSFPAVTFLISGKNPKGEEGILFPIWLPSKAIKKFEKELNNILRTKTNLQRLVNILNLSSPPWR